MYHYTLVCELFRRKNQCHKLIHSLVSLNGDIHKHKNMKLIQCREKITIKIKNFCCFIQQKFCFPIVYLECKNRCKQEYIYHRMISQINLHCHIILKRSLYDKTCYFHLLDSYLNKTYTCIGLIKPQWTKTRIKPSWLLKKSENHEN